MKTIDKLQLPLFILGLCLLCFIAGAAVLHFKLPMSGFLSQAFEGQKAWSLKTLYDMSSKDAPVDLVALTEKPKISWNKKEAFDGYTLITLRFGSSPYLVDMNGKVIHRWNMPFRKAWPKPAHIPRAVADDLIFIEGVQVFPNGDLLAIYTGYTDTPWGYGMVRMDKDSNVLWTYDQQVHHNATIDLETGNIYTLVHYFMHKPQAGLPDLPYPVLADAIVTLSGDGKELDRIPLVEAFKGTPFEPYLYHFPDVPGLASWDLLHPNSIAKLESSMALKFPMFAPGQLLVSFRAISTIAVIDPDSKKVVWAAKGPWQQQHDARFLPNGNILLMDNLGYYANQTVTSQVLEYDPGTTAIAWRFPGNKNYKFLNTIYGHSQRLPNGNTLIGEVFGLGLVEVTPAGKTVWSYRLDIPEQPSFKGMAMKQGGKWHAFPEHLLMYHDLNRTPAMVFHQRYARDALPFINPASINQNANP